MSHSLLPMSPEAALPALLAREQATLLDDLYAQAELDAICAALFADIGPGETLPPR